MGTSASPNAAGRHAPAWDLNDVVLEVRRDESGRRARVRCARLGERRHGRWYFRCSTRDLWGRRDVLRRGGFASRAAARRARDEVLGLSREERTGQIWT